MSDQKARSALRAASVLLGDARAEVNNEQLDEQIQEAAGIVQDVYDELENDD